MDTKNFKDLGKIFSGGNPGGFAFRPPSGKFLTRSMITAGVAAMLVFWLLGGVYTVKLYERGIVLFLGKHVQTTEPGIHWFFPAPFGEVIKPRVEEVKRIEIGFRTISHDPVRTTPPQEYSEESLMLTRGANIIDIDMSVQYQIADPVKYLFNIADRQADITDNDMRYTIKGVAESALRQVVGQNQIDDILTTKKNIIQIDIQRLMQEILDKYESGIRVMLVQLQDVHPPTEVTQAFKDVNNAEEDKHRMIREGEGYYNSVIPQARGEAATILADAEAYREAKISRAKGDAARFEEQLAEYSKAREITKKRLYLETMEYVLKGMNKVILDDSTKKNVLPLMQLGGGKKEQPAVQMPETEELAAAIAQQLRGKKAEK